MTEMAQRRELERAVPLAALFTAFLIVSLCGFSGGIVWARRIAGENRRGIIDGEFADIVSLCQFERHRPRCLHRGESARRCRADPGGRWHPCAATGRPC